MWTCRIIVLLVLVFVAVVLGGGGHRKHGQAGGHHKHRENKHHNKIMAAIAEFDTCVEDADDDETDLGACVTEHLADMRKCIVGLNNHFKTVQLPKPVKKFISCFRKLTKCVADGKLTDCPAHMIECVGAKKEGHHHHHHGKKKVAGKGVLQHAPQPIKNSVKDYIRCKYNKTIPVSNCTRKHIKEVANILNWAHLGRCQMGQFLCEALDGDNCLQSLTDSEKKCVKREPFNPNTDGLPPKVATLMGKMAEALKCIKTEWESSAPNNTRYVECVYNSDYITNEWTKDEGRHVYCYSKLKSCNGDAETTKSSCTSDYAECRGDGH